MHRTAMAMVLLLMGAPLACTSAEGPAQAPAERPFAVSLDIPQPQDSAGGILVADIDNDSRMDFLVTVPGHVAAYANGGAKLWVLKVDVVVGGSSEREGLPGHHGPGLAAGDVDGDGRCEVLFLTKDSVLHILDGQSGQEKASAAPPYPSQAERWEVAMLADFHGSGGDPDILLQATNKDGYRMGRYLAAYSMTGLLRGDQPLWQVDDFVGCAHNSARLADLDGDGRDEVLGETILSSEGKLLTRAIPDRYHVDSIFVADVRPDRPGLEVVLLEEGSNHIQLLGRDGPIWRTHFERQEPQNAAVGRFRNGSEEIFIWCRSRHNEHQKPFVFDSSGAKVYGYSMDAVAPSGWTARGVESIHTIDWTGEPQQLACAKERHESGDVCLFEPLTGRFVKHIEEKADRLYVADVTGDWREEIIVLSGNTLHVYHNDAPNPRPGHRRLWTDRNYRRLKQNHNYYSP